MSKIYDLNSIDPKIYFSHYSAQINQTISINFAGLTSNSQSVKPNWLFIAEKGVSQDGHQYIPQAIKQGASGLIVENLEKVPPQYEGVVFFTKNTRNMMPQIASHFFGKPSEKIFCVGVTGTNGKTSLTYLVEHLLNSVNKKTGVIGTINHHLGQKVWPTNLTTPHTTDLQHRLDEFVKLGAKSLAIEVSSHAVDQGRIYGIEFDVGIFTNLTRDHLDYHSSMEEYFKAKEKFFSELLAGSNKKKLYAIINNDDPWGSKIKTPKNVIRWSYGNNSSDFTFLDIEMDLSGTRFKLNTPFGQTQIKSPLIGLHNIYNVQAATAAALVAEMSLQQIQDALSTFPGIPGRLQRVPTSNGVSVFIDYAHSPDALENVLISIKKLRERLTIKGKIICVFGCGGDRDKGKRPLMAKVAEKHSDIIIITSDNPRTEDPLKILNDIEIGFSKHPEVKIIRETRRENAISIAINEAQPNDIILIAGKGHEDYQIIGKDKFYFSDFESVRKLTL